MAPPSTAPVPRASHSRSTSAASNAPPPKPPPVSSKRLSNPPQIASSIANPVEPRVHCTVLIRLPFAREAFADPAPVEWDSIKDRALWKIISNTPKSGDLDWAEMAKRFGVSAEFMLQQAAWLYERHLKHMKAQMKRMTSTKEGGVAMRRTGSGGESRAPSALSIRSRDSPIPKVEASGEGTPRPGVSRTPSTQTATQSGRTSVPPSPRQPLNRSFRTSFPPLNTKLPPRPSHLADERANNSPMTVEATTKSPTPPSPSSLGPPSSSSESSDSDTPAHPALRRSQLLRRGPPRGGKALKSPQLPRLDSSGGAGVADDDASSNDDEGSSDSPTFLPFAAAAKSGPSQADKRLSADLSGTLRGGLGGVERRTSVRSMRGRRETVTSPTNVAPPAVAKEAVKPPLVETEESRSEEKGKQPAAPSEQPTSPSDMSAASSSQDQLQYQSSTGNSSPDIRRTQSNRVHQQQQRPPGPLSPRHRAQLAGLNSPGRRGLQGREGSDGTPSMGSSFSDLDDASVTQSALEDALMSNIQAGRMGSRFSAFGQSLRDRYL